MFSALHTHSPRVDISTSDVFSHRSPESDVGETGLPAIEAFSAGSGGGGGGGGAGGGAGGYGGQAGISGGAMYPEESGDMAGYYDDQPTPLPPSPQPHWTITQSNIGYTYNPTYSPPPASNTLIDNPELYTQFIHPTYPTYHTYSPTSDVEVFPPPLSRVLEASTALRTAISQPHLNSTPHYPTQGTGGETGYAGSGRHHPYARTPTMGRSGSTASLRHISTTSSALSMAPSAMSMGYSAGRSVSSFSTASVPSLSSGYSSAPTSRSASGGSADGYYTTMGHGEVYADATSRYFDGSTSAGGTMESYGGQAVYMPSFGAKEAGAEGSHLFMSGLGLSLGAEAMVANERAGKAAGDDEVWKSVRGPGLFGGDSDEEDESDDEGEDKENGEAESEELAGPSYIPSSSPIALTPAASPAEPYSPLFPSEPFPTGTILTAPPTADDHADEESDSDTPLAPLRGRVLVPSSSPLVVAQSSPTPASRHSARIDEALLVPDVDGPSAGQAGTKNGAGAEKAKPKPKKKRSAGRGRGTTHQLALSEGAEQASSETFTLGAEAAVLVDERQAEGLRMGQEKGFGLGVAVEDEDEVVVQPSKVTVASESTPAPSRAKAGKKTKSHPSPRYTSSPDNPHLSAAQPPSTTQADPTPSLTEDPEVLLRPSGRPQRAAGPPSRWAPSSQIKTEALSSEDGNDDPEEAEWMDDEPESEEGTPLRDIKPSLRRTGARRGGRRVKREETYDDRDGILYMGKAKKRRVDPEAMIKVETLRERCVDPKKRTGNFDEKLCQLLVDARFSHLICWNDAGDKIVIADFEAFWTTAGPFVMCTETKRSAFDKQLSNHGFKRESTYSDATGKQCKTLTHPMLSRDDKDLWAAVGKRRELIKWGKGVTSSANSTRSSLRKTIAEKNAQILALTAQLQSLTLEKERGLVEYARLFPSAWTAYNISTIFGLQPTDIPTSINLPPLLPSSPKKPKSVPQDQAVNQADKKVVRKRSRQGAMASLPETKEVAESAAEDEAEGQAGEAKVEKKVGRKRSKLGLTSPTKKK